MNDSQVDFSQFPRIIPPSEIENKEELERRSTAIRAIRDAQENLVKLIESYIADLIGYDAKVRILDQRENALKEGEFELIQKQKEIYVLEDEVKQEKKYVIKANLDIKAREKDLLIDKKVLEDINREKEEWKLRKEEALRQEAIVESKIKSVDTINKHEKELEERENLVTKKEQMATEKQRLLDIREIKLKAVEQRYEIEQQE